MLLRTRAPSPLRPSLWLALAPLLLPTAGCRSAVIPEALHQRPADAGAALLPTSEGAVLILPMEEDALWVGLDRQGRERWSARHSCPVRNVGPVGVDHDRGWLLCHQQDRVLLVDGASGREGLAWSPGGEVLTAQLAGPAVFAQVDDQLHSHSAEGGSQAQRALGDLLLLSAGIDAGGARAVLTGVDGALAAWRSQPGDDDWRTQPGLPYRAAVVTDDAVIGTTAEGLPDAWEGADGARRWGADDLLLIEVMATREALLAAGRTADGEGLIFALDPVSLTLLWEQPWPGEQLPLQLGQSDDLVWAAGPQLIGGFDGATGRPLGAVALDGHITPSQIVATDSHLMVLGSTAAAPVALESMPWQAELLPGTAVQPALPAWLGPGSTLTWLLVDDARAEPEAEPLVSQPEQTDDGGLTLRWWRGPQLERSGSRAVSAEALASSTHHRDHFGLAEEDPATTSLVVSRAVIDSLLVGSSTPFRDDANSLGQSLAPVGRTWLQLPWVDPETEEADFRLVPALRAEADAGGARYLIAQDAEFPLLLWARRPASRQLLISAGPTL